MIEKAASDYDPGDLPAHPSSPPIVFIHIGKTAGTSLRVILEEAFGEGNCSAPFVQNHMTEQEATGYRKFPAICGHISKADQLKWFPERKVITVLRDPIDRCLSFLYYVRGLPLCDESAQIVKDAHSLSILDLIETQEAQTNLHNTMVRQLGGHMLDEPTDFPALLEKAKETLREAFWVGRQDTLDADLHRLGALLGCGLEMRRTNVTRDRRSIGDEDPRVINRLYALNGYDLQLWKWWVDGLGAR